MVLVLDCPVAFTISLTLQRAVSFLAAFAGLANIKAMVSVAAAATVVATLLLVNKFPFFI